MHTLAMQAEFQGNATVHNALLHREFADVLTTAPVLVFKIKPRLRRCFPYFTSLLELPPLSVYNSDVDALFLCTGHSQMRVFFKYSVNKCMFKLSASHKTSAQEITNTLCC